MDTDKEEAERRITVEYREPGGAWEDSTVAILSTSNVIDLLVFLTGINPATYRVLSEDDQKA